MNIFFTKSGTSRRRPACSPIGGFTLIEMLGVMAIIAIIMALAIPSVSTLLKGTGLTQASQMFNDQISLARQQALTRNRAVEVRLLSFVDPESPREDPANPPFRAIQILEVLENGTAIPMDKLQRFPTGIMMDPGPLSSLLSGAGQTVMTPDATAPELPGVQKNYRYVRFRFQQDGSTNLDPTGLWFVTLYSVTDNPKNDGRTTPPPNFSTVQIDPVSGALKNYRPGLK